MCEKILTVIIPTYNAERYLNKGLESLLIGDKELMEKLDVLIIDDGSKDSGAKVAQTYIDQYPTVYRMIQKENGGHGSVINLGAKEARGRFFKVLDADDWVDKDGFASYLRKLETLDADAVITPYQRYDIRDKSVDNQIPRPGKYAFAYDLDQMMDQWLTCHPGLHFWGITYNTAFYQNLHYNVLEGVFYEDQEYATIPLCHAKQVVFLEDMVYIYRVGDVNQSVFGDTQVRRRSHLEAVIDRLIAQERSIGELSSGGVRYWRKKTAMAVTSYYQIMLLKNKDKKQGRRAVAGINAKLKEQAPDIYRMTEKKCKAFVIFSYLHLSNDLYERYAPRIIARIRARRQKRI